MNFVSKLDRQLRLCYLSPCASATPELLRAMLDEVGPMLETLGYSGDAPS